MIHSNRISGQLSEREHLSVGLEISALASAALDNLVAWYHALSQWWPHESQRLLVDILYEVRVEDSHRLNALKSVKGARADTFCHEIGIPWVREDLQSRSIDQANLRYTVEQAKLNIAKALEDLSPHRLKAPRAWVFRYLNSVYRELLVEADRHKPIPQQAVPSKGAGAPFRDNETIANTPIDQESLNELVGMIGNAAVGLYCLVRLLYITAFRDEPRSPAFVGIWQDLHPDRGRGP